MGFAVVESGLGGCGKGGVGGEKWCFLNGVGEGFFLVFCLR